jgi:predicted MFS family arabinose efflux permease
VQAGLGKDHHWQVYLPAVLASFVLMGGLLFPLERRGYLRGALRGAVALMLAVQGGFALVAWQAGSGIVELWPLAGLLFLFFCGFNALEASQPSLVSKLAPPSLRGAALGLYNTLQSLGLFAGGALGGMLVKLAGAPVLFAATTALCAIWLLFTWGLKPIGQAPAGTH